MLLSATLLVTLLSFHTTFALPHKAIQSPSISLLRKRQPTRNGDWARKQADILRSKYGPGSIEKRATSGGNQLVNQNTDSSYYGSLAVGTPPKSYDVILDTGSSDLWLAGRNCRSCGDVPKYDPSQSSTFKNMSTPFQITYGSGGADGVLGSDVVQMAGFQVSNQVFAVCNAVSSGLLDNPVSGLLGLAFDSIAISKATPFWQSLVQGKAWTQPVFSFFLTRFIDSPNARDEEPGGEFVMGTTNTSLYTGDIDFIDVPDGQSTYWILPMKAMTVQGSSIPLPSGSASYAAIDTGTTLIGGPANTIASIFAQIPGSSHGTGDYESYWTYPCSTEVNIDISFGSRTWKINPVDFKLSQISATTCLGAFFELKMGSTAPAWIIGDTFLKNVYSVFRFTPPSIGFAELSNTALSFAISGASLPTPTIGENPAIATGRLASGALSIHSLHQERWTWVALVATFTAMMFS